MFACWKENRGWEAALPALKNLATLLSKDTASTHHGNPMKFMTAYSPNFLLTHQRPDVWSLGMWFAFLTKARSQLPPTPRFLKTTCSWFFRSVPTKQFRFIVSLHY